MMASSENRSLLLVVDSLSKEKGIDREIVFDALEKAGERVGKNKYGNQYDIRSAVDRKTGEFRFFRHIAIVEEVEEEETETQMTLEEAQLTHPAIALGDEIIEQLPTVDFTRTEAQSMRQVIVQKLRAAERERQHGEFKEKEHTIITGIVKSSEYGNYIIDLGTAEGFLHRRQCLPNEKFQRGHRVRCIISEVSDEPKGPLIFLSRTRPEFMVELFRQEVPEIYEGTIEIKNCVRDPGSRAKIGVHTSDPTIDPIGACIGMRGSRVQAVTYELGGEKVDIILWREDLVSYIVGAFTPAEVVKVVVDEERPNRFEVVVPDNQLSIAIGRRGQNVQLASMLTRTEIDVRTETDESERTQQKIRKFADVFADALNVDEAISRLLAIEGFNQIEQIAWVEPAEIESIDGFDASIAEELQARAANWLKLRDEEIIEKLHTMDVDPELMAVEEFTAPMLEVLASNEILNLTELAYCSNDELAARPGSMPGDSSDPGGLLYPFILMGHIDAETIEALIMGARRYCGLIEDEDEAEAAGEDVDIEAAEGDVDIEAAGEEVDIEAAEGDVDTEAAGEEVDTEAAGEEVDTPESPESPETPTA